MEKINYTSDSADGLILISPYLQVTVRLSSIARHLKSEFHLLLSAVRRCSELGIVETWRSSVQANAEVPMSSIAAQVMMELLTLSS